MKEVDVAAHMCVLFGRFTHNACLQAGKPLLWLR